MEILRQLVSLWIASMIIAEAAIMHGPALCKEEGLWGTAWCLIVKTGTLACDTVAFNIASMIGWIDARFPASFLMSFRSMRQEIIAFGVVSRLQNITSQAEWPLTAIAPANFSVDISNAMDTYQRSFVADFPEHGTILQRQDVVVVGAWLLVASVIFLHFVRVGISWRRQSEVLFFPDKSGKNLERICKHISCARRRVWLAMFTLTDDLLSDAVRDAHLRGVDVRVIVDDAQSDIHGADAQWLADSGVPVTTDKSWALMHHKFVILDDAVLSGSFNWTKQASVANNENLCVLHDAKILKGFVCEFKRLWARFNGRGGRLLARKQKRRCQTPPVRKA